MLASLPQGSRMIATGVITPFLIPMKIGLMAAFLAQEGFVDARVLHGGGRIPGCREPAHQTQRDT